MIWAVSIMTQLPSGAASGGMETGHFRAEKMFTAVRSRREPYISLDAQKPEFYDFIFRFSSERV